MKVNLVQSIIKDKITGLYINDGRLSSNPSIYCLKVARKIYLQYNGKYISKSKKCHVCGFVRKSIICDLEIIKIRISEIKNLIIPVKSSEQTATVMPA